MSNGGDIESITQSSILHLDSTHRSTNVTRLRTIIQSIYPNTESVQWLVVKNWSTWFGTVSITIKPKNGEFVSDFDKTQILSKLKGYSLTGINQKILDLKLLYVELESFVYYDLSKVTTVSNLKTKIINGLTTYAKSVELNKFGGRFKYSKVLNVIDKIDDAISSNITRVIIRRNLKALITNLHNMNYVMVMISYKSWKKY